MSVSVSKLQNGLTVVTEFIPHVETAAIGLFVKVGSRYEDVGDQGISHFLEHMAFKGTQRRTARQIAEEIECVGGRLNAATGHETTSYYASVLKENVSLALDILGDILTGSTFNLEEIERERSVIIEEIRATHDTPESIVWDLFFESAYAPHQALGRSILGKPETVSRFTPAALSAYMKQHYCGSRMVLSVAGHISHEEICDLVASSLGQLPADSCSVMPASVYCGGERRLERNLEQTQFVIGFSAPGFFDLSFYTARILAIIMGEGMSSRLFQEIREIRGLCYSISAVHIPYHDTGLFAIQAGTAMSNLPELLDSIISQMHRAARDIREDELLRAQQQIKAEYMVNMEYLSGRMDRMAHYMLLFGRVIPISEIFEKFQSVTVDHLRMLSEHLCLDCPPSLSVVGSFASLESYDKIADRLRIS